jgi:hypothetical protein
MTQRADVYPNMWYGIWSGPDAYIADYAENAGEAFYHLPTPMCDFPLMNLNIHACYLLSVIKMAGIETDFDMIRISPKIKDQDFSFNSPLMSLKVEPNSLYFRYEPINSKDLKIKFKKPGWWKEGSKISLNERDITKDVNIVLIDKNYITVFIKEKIIKIEIRIQ